MRTKFPKDKIPDLLAVMEVASFFVIAISEKFNRWLHFVRNDKKDRTDSATSLLRN